jgi:hypothetical protein
MAKKQPKQTANADKFESLGGRNHSITKNTDKWKSFGGRANDHKDYKHLVGSNPMKKKGKGNALLMAVMDMPMMQKGKAANAPKKGKKMMDDMMDDDMKSAAPKKKKAKKDKKRGY